jgi:hypothetical protein
MFEVAVSVVVTPDEIPVSVEPSPENDAAVHDPATVTFPVNEGDANGAFASREVCRLVTFAIVCVCAVGANVVDARRASLTLVSAIG